MDGQGRRLTLIVPGKARGREDLRQALHRLGFEVDLVRCSAESCVDVNRYSGLIVLYFEQALEPCPRFEALLQQLVQNPRLWLAIADPGCLQSSQQLLAGCTELLTWPCDERELAWRLDRVGYRHNRQPKNLLNDGFVKQLLEINLVGRSPAFMSAVGLMQKTVKCDAPVLVKGETGTGKEVAARAIHYLGERRDYPFIPVNCGAIPDTLLENELFGHEKGAYTDARDAQSGLVTQAHMGTLFLDEIDTLSAKAQVVLLRFLQEQEFKPLGGKEIRSANVRVLAASNVDLKALVDEGRFRQDLYFRLNILSVCMPALRDRPEDIELLAYHFIRKYSGQYKQAVKLLDPQSQAWIKSYHWPGNIRELDNMIHRAFIMSESETICLSDALLMEQQPTANDVAGPGNFDVSFKEAKQKMISEFEKNYFTSLMRATKGNVTLAAKWVGKERRSLGKLLKKHGIDRESL